MKTRVLLTVLFFCPACKLTETRETGKRLGDLPKDSIGSGSDAANANVPRFFLVEGTEKPKPESLLVFGLAVANSNYGSRAQFWVDGRADKVRWRVCPARFNQGRCINGDSGTKGFLLPVDQDGFHRLYLQACSSDRGLVKKPSDGEICGPESSVEWLQVSYASKETKFALQELRAREARLRDSGGKVVRTFG